MMNYFVKQVCLIMFFILTFNLAVAQRNAANHDTTISYRTQIENDTCRVFIESIQKDSLTAKLWLVRKNKKMWETTIHKSKFRAPFYDFVRLRSDDTSSLSEKEISWGFLTSKELKSIQFKNLVFEQFTFDFIRSSRLHYKAIFRDQKTNIRYVLLPGIIYDEEKEIKKLKKKAIMVFGIHKIT